MHTLQLNARNVQMLGRILIKKRPDLANEFLQECMEQMAAPVKDTSLIGYYFEAYCTEIGTQKDVMLSSNKDHSVSKRRKEFIGLVLKIYHPYIFTNKCICFKPTKGLITSLSLTLQMNKGNVSHAVQEVCKWIELYQDFKVGIETLYGKIIESE